jgi:hypothetical protein
MDLKNISKIISHTNKETCVAALELMLATHTKPVFGAAKIIEHEVAAFLA